VRSNDDGNIGFLQERARRATPRGGAVAGATGDVLRERPRQTFSSSTHTTKNTGDWSDEVFSGPEEAKG